MKLELGTDGAWALCKDDLRHVKVKERKRVMAAFDQTEGGDGMRSLAVADAIIALIVEEWSLPYPLPKDDPTVLDELDVADYDPLMNRALALQDQLFVDFGPTPAPDSPTGPSGG